MRSRPTRALPVLGLFWILSLNARSALGSPGQVGQWSAAVDAGVTAVHAVLMRGPSDSTRVLVWSSGTTARLWRYSHGAAFSTADVIQVPCASNIFCGGHAALSDGRLLMANGHIQNGEGLDDANLFDPLSNLWTPQTPSFHPRWYPTATSLPDGRVLVSSGDKYLTMETFGGSGGTPTQLVSQLTLGEEPGWIDWPSLSPTPSAREDHSAIYDLNLTSTVVFSGKNAGGTPLADVWLLKRTDTDTSVPDHTWAWTSLTPAPDPVHGVPIARSRHTAIHYQSDSSMVVYGGLDASAVPLSDCWKLYLRRRGSSTVGQWQRITAVAPKARYAHTAIFGLDLPYLTGLGLNPVMVVFGGHDGTAETDSVWALKLAPGLEQWVALAPTGTAPSPRYGHSATQVPVIGATPARMLVFGGRQGSTYLNNIRGLEWATTGPRWISFSPTSPPSPRARHSAIHDGVKLVVFGGESAPGSPLADCKAAYTPSLTSWVSYAPQAPLARAGHSAIYHPTTVLARIPEAFTPTPDNLGSWQEYPNALRRLSTYPFMFVLPNGKLFYAGRTMATRTLDLTTGLWSATAYTSGFQGGSAAMYRPGMILKNGSKSATPLGTTERIDLTSATPQWIAEGQSIARSEANLTLLPTGDVLLTGGCTSDTCTVQRMAQIWKLGVGWTAGLAMDPMRRDYHSTAVLLPDGRVFSGGGDDWGTDRLKVTIYSPPYLFDAGGAPAPRPQITAAPSTINYQHPFNVYVPDGTTIASACLIKPSAVTHGFNQDQRYVPLTFTALADPWRLVVQAPADSNLAPPGDYMLFVVDAAGVPSIASWIRVAPTRGAPVGVGGDAPGLALAMGPNPARTSASIRYHVDPGQAGLPMDLAVFDLQGRRICTLARGRAMAGVSSATWDLLSERHAPVRNGVYLVRLALGSTVRTERIVVAR